MAQTLVECGYGVRRAENGFAALTDMRESSALRLERADCRRGLFRDMEDPQFEKIRSRAGVWAAC
jgi:hypothetical protein